MGLPIKFKVCPNCGSEDIHLKRYDLSMVNKTIILSGLDVVYKCKVCKHETSHKYANAELFKKDLEDEAMERIEEMLGDL